MFTIAFLFLLNGTFECQNHAIYASSRFIASFEFMGFGGFAGQKASDGGCRRRRRMRIATHFIKANRVSSCRALKELAGLKSKLALITPL